MSSESIEEARKLGAVDPNGKSQFYVANKSLFYNKEVDQLSDIQRIEWKSFQLWKSTTSIERRDSIYQAINQSDFQFHVTHHILGSPYPVIEPVPGIMECTCAIRWYEHGLCLFGTILYLKYLTSSPKMRWNNIAYSGRRALTGGVFFGLEGIVAHRSYERLIGLAENDYEATKYGVFESADRLEKKKVLWTKFKEYKEEWMRRYDYHLMGLRPGDTYSLNTPSIAPTWPVRFATKTDYSPRKNPFMLSSKPVHDMWIESGYMYNMKSFPDTPEAQARPEITHLYKGPTERL